MQQRLGHLINASDFRARTKPAGEIENKFLLMIYIPGFLSHVCKTDAETPFKAPDFPVVLP